MNRTRALAAAAATAVALATAGCAYYNTFYYARTQFRLAFPRRADAFLATGSPTGGQNAALESTLVRCRRVITNYAGSKWVDDAYLLAGKSYYGKGKYTEAIQRLTALSDSFPRSDLLAEAITFRGAARIKKGDVEAGRDDLADVRKRWPKYEYRDLATYLLAESYRADREYEQALPFYAEIVQDDRSSPVWDQASLQAGVCLSKLRRFEEARTYLARVGRRKVSADVEFDALRILGETYLDERRFAEAEKAFRTMLDQIEERTQAGQAVTANPTQLKSEARIRVAQAQNGQGEHEDALKSLQAVVEESPRTTYAAEAQFDIGYTYEVYLNDAQKARDAYAGVREQAPASQFAARAASRSKNLERLRTMRLTEAPDPAERAFAAAELTMIDLEKPQDARAQYDAVRRRYPHSEYAQKAAYALAWSRLTVDKDTSGAIAAFTSVLRRYPETIYAEDARFLLRRLGVEAPDSTPIVVDWAVLVADSAAVTDSLAPFDVRADSLARAAAEHDSTLARQARARGDSLRAAVALQDSIENANAAQGRTGERDDRPGSRRPGSRPSPFGPGQTPPPGAIVPPDSLGVPGRRPER